MHRCIFSKYKTLSINDVGAMRYLYGKNDIRHHAYIESVAAWGTIRENTDYRFWKNIQEDNVADNIFINLEI